MKLKIKAFVCLALAGCLLYSCNKNMTPSLVSVKEIKTFDTAAFNYVFVEGIKQKLMGNGGDALKMLEQAVRINPKSDAGYFQIAQILLATGDLKNGKKYALEAYSLDKSNFWYVIMLAGTYYEEKNIDSAIIFYEKAVKLEPQKESLQITLAGLYSENKKYDRAEQILEEIDRKYGVNKASSGEIVKNLMWSGKWNEALDKANELIKAFPDEILFNGLLAEIYRGKGEPDKASEVYKSLIDRNPGNPEIQLAICDFLIEEKRYDELMALLNTIVLNDRITREDKMTLFARIIENKAILQANMDKVKLSVMVLEAAYPKDDIIMLLRPDALTAAGDLDGAAKRLEEIVKERKENYFAWEKLLFVYLQKADYLNLERKAAECATMFNRSFVAKLLYATAATENGNYKVAGEEIEKAEILAGNDNEMILQVLSLKADLLYRTGEYDKAFAVFREALSRKKDDITIMNNYAYYLAEQNMNLKEAEALAKQVIIKEGNNNTYLDTYAWVLYKRGKYKEAEKIMKSIIDGNNDNDAEYYEHYGYILKKRHNCAEAAKSWEKAISIDKNKTGLMEEINNCKK